MKDISFFIAFSISIFCHSISAQEGWEITYGTPSVVGREVFHASDGRFLAVSHLSPDVFGQETNGVQVSKVTSDGQVLWEKDVVGLNGNHLVASKNADGFLRVGSFVENVGPIGFRVVTLDEAANLVGQYLVPLPGLLDNFYGAAVMLSDGGIFISYPREDFVSGIQCLRFDKQGVQVFTTLLPNDKPEIYDGNLLELPDGSILLIHRNYETRQIKVASIHQKGQINWDKQPIPDLNSYHSVLRLYFLGQGQIAICGRWLLQGNQDLGSHIFSIDSQTGNLLWQNDFEEFPFCEFRTAISDGLGGVVVLADDVVRTAMFRFSNTGQKIFSKSFDVLGTKIIKTLDENFVFGGVQYVPFGTGGGGWVSDNVGWVKFDKNGNTIWKTIGTKSSGKGTYVPRSMIFDNTGNLISFGNYRESITTPNSSTSLAPLNHFAKLLPDGRLYRRLIRGQVFYDSITNCQNDLPESTLENWMVKATANGKERFTQTSGDGQFNLWTNDSLTDLQLIPKNDFWGVCQSSYPIVFSQSDTAFQNLPATAEILCPRFDLSAGTWFLRRCFDNFYKISWCNSGTVLSKNTHLTVKLDSFFEFKAANFPLVAQNGQELTFDVGDVAVGDCGFLNLEFLLSCDADSAQIHCLSAKIRAENVDCLNQPGAAGETTDCQPNRGSFDPNSKHGFIAGTEKEGEVAAVSEIEYQINFQNTGSDTAFLVTLLDTLSDKFDVETVVFGASSHPYRWSIYGQGVLKIDFPGIRLPHKSQNETASQGFVKFKIKIKHDQLFAGNEIENAAAIYFDFNKPVITNKHQLRFTTTDTKTKRNDVVSAMIFPNPASQEIYLNFSEKILPPIVLVKIFNQKGQFIKALSLPNSSTNYPKIDISDLSEGVYFLHVLLPNQMNFVEKFTVFNKQ